MNISEIVNLIRKLKQKGLSSDEILDIIEYIEITKPKKHHEEDKKDNKNNNK